MLRTVTPLLVVLAFATGTTAQDHSFLRKDVLGALRWRSVGPVNFGGRIVDIEVHPQRRSTFYIATASGGLFKTTTNGTAFRPVFENEPSFSIGDLAIAPSDPDVLYLGTGEANNQRSSYWGDGVYRSTDAGKTWQNVGLAGTEHIGRIVVHPDDADVVFVAAAGALYTPNNERGVYRSVDGGTTWELVKFIGADVGFIDVLLDPHDPDTVYAASYERRRRAHHFDEGGPGSGIWRSTDAGDTWTRLGGGLPDGEIGRIGLAAHRGADHTVLYACVENANRAPSTRRADREPGRDRETDQDDAPAPALVQRRERKVGGEIYRSDDGGETWTKTNERPVGGSPGYYYGQIRVDPQDAQRVYVLSVRAYHSDDGGKTFRSDFASRLHSDHHALWIDPADPAHALIGNDGGLGETWDRGKTWRYRNDLPIGQFYAVAVDQRDPYRIYGGTQDNGTWGIPTRGASSRGLQKADAFKINGGDGFQVAIDPTNPDTVYAESQFGRLSRIDLGTGARTSIRPRAERGSPKLRFNWMSPIALSPHNPFTIYFGSQHVHRSRDRGDHWTTISPDLTTNDPEKIAGNVPHCTVTTIAESPVTEGLLWAGTDDGKVWVSRNGGQRWTDLAGRFPGLPKPLWVSRVEPSREDEDIAYVTFTGYREDLRVPFVYLTTDGGESFRSIANNLPPTPVNVIREHPRKPGTLFVGHEFGVHVSIDGGATWHGLGSGLPTTPVHDLVVHPREDDLVLATHGRGFWTLDITVLNELDESVLAEDFHAFVPRDGVLLPAGFSRGYGDGGGWTGRNPELAASFSYYLNGDTDETIEVEVVDATGQRLFRRAGDKRAGLHVVTWNPRSRGARGAGRPGCQPAVTAGHYSVRYHFGDRVVIHPFSVRAATEPPLPPSWTR